MTISGTQRSEHVHLLSFNEKPGVKDQDPSKLVEKLAPWIRYIHGLKPHMPFFSLIGYYVELPWNIDGQKQNLNECV